MKRASEYSDIHPPRPTRSRKQVDRMNIDTSSKKRYDNKDNYFQKPSLNQGKHAELGREVWNYCRYNQNLSIRMEKTETWMFWLHALGTSFTEVKKHGTLDLHYFDGYEGLGRFADQAGFPTGEGDAWIRSFGSNKSASLSPEVDDKVTVLYDHAPLRSTSFIDSMADERNHNDDSEEDEDFIETVSTTSSIADENQELLLAYMPENTPKRIAVRVSVTPTPQQTMDSSKPGSGYLNRLRILKSTFSFDNIGNTMLAMSSDLEREIFGDNDDPTTKTALEKSVPILEKIAKDIEERLKKLEVMALGAKQISSLSKRMLNLETFVHGSSFSTNDCIIKRLVDLEKLFG
mmetsp:Transcript_7150/g.9067  ORF Transcript_7150/g.9067 Transcript_7150/m.9067 type:complete len:347 (+) Transcript_7150:34-1074(+)